MVIMCYRYSKSCYVSSLEMKSTLSTSQVRNVIFKGICLEWIKQNSSLRFGAMWTNELNWHISSQVHFKMLLKNACSKLPHKACVYRVLCDVVSRLQELNALVHREQEDGGVGLGTDYKINRVSWFGRFYRKRDIYLWSNKDRMIQMIY